MRILGIDYGSARIGIAMGDTEARIASPWSVIAGDADAVASIQDIIKKESVERVIVGIPRPLQNQEGENAQMRSIRNFIERLRAVNITVEESDETLTTRLADIQSHESNRKGPTDDLAAAVMLQGWLDRESVSR
ncbi:MAG: Holliday junction resolvase RuvX [Patescibacteria group bacterium]